jgi:hypothetical protein
MPVCTSGCGADGLLLRQSAAGEALAEHMDSDNRGDGDCATDVGVDTTWRNGPLACYDNNADAATLWWGYAESGLNIIAVRNDGDNAALWQWFAGADWASPSGPPS